jgi:hypothetical protein
MSDINVRPPIATQSSDRQLPNKGPTPNCHGVSEMLPVYSVEDVPGPYPYRLGAPTPCFL